MFENDSIGFITNIRTQKLIKVCFKISTFSHDPMNDFRTAVGQATEMSIFPLKFITKPQICIRL